MKEWWREFFDDDYLFLYARELDPARTELEVAAAVGLLELRERDRVLDLCCGDGRHSVPLHRRGYRVTGVDVSDPLLRRARQRAGRVLPDGDPGPAFVRADARALPLREAFDAAALFFNSIGYGTDADTLSMLAQARAVLRRGGCLFFDCVHRDQMVLGMRAGARRAVEVVAGVPVDVSSWIDPIEGIAHAVFSWSRAGEQRSRELRHRLYTATELGALLRQAGFARHDFRGGYDGRPFEMEAPILVARAWA